MHLTPEHIQSFQNKLLTWYSANKRDLPWRHTRDPYKILMSEVMSQQTQISRVVPLYEEWLSRFPTVYELAKATIGDVLRYWSGLGYNRRALYVQRAAQVIIKDFSGKFPSDVDQLIKLPGIGIYTASAVVCFAFDAQIPVIDTNIRKVITYEFCSGQLLDEITIRKIALEILPYGQAYVWNQALMDYSSIILRDKKIPLPKQSPFYLSNRYYRGQVIKLLLQVPVLSTVELKDYFSKKHPISLTQLEEILLTMSKEGMIDYKQNIVILPNK